MILEMSLVLLEGCLSCGVESCYELSASTSKEAMVWARVVLGSKFPL